MTESVKVIEAYARFSLKWDCIHRYLVGLLDAV